MISRSSFLRMLAAGGMALSLSPATSAAGWPAQPVKLVVPYAPGGPTDIVARHFGTNLQRVLGQSVVVENKPGAQGALGTVAVKDSRPDGYTLLVHEIPGSFAILPAIMRKPSYNGTTDFTPISMLASGPIFLLVNTTMPVNNLKELVALAKTRPGGVTYGSSGGMGQMPTHMGPEIFSLRSGMEARNIVYRGAGPAMLDLAAGRVDFVMTTGLVAAMPFLDSGKVRVVAVTSKERYPGYPAIPTFAESGFPVPELEGGTIFGVLGPAGMPADVVAVLSDAVQKVMASPEFQAQLKPLMMSAYPRGGPQELRKVMQHEIDVWTPVVRKLNLQAD